MKVMQMNCWLKSGSTGKIVYAIQNYVRNKGDKTYAIYGLGEKSASPNELRTTPELIRKAQSFRSRITGYPYGGCIWGTETAIRFIKKVEPDIVHIHCINGYMVSIYKILDFLKNNHIPNLITNYKKHTVETRLIRFYTTMNQALKMSIAENGQLSFHQVYQGDSAYLTEWYRKYIIKYIKTIKEEGPEANNNYYKVTFIDGSGFASYYGGQSADGTPGSGNINIFYYINGNSRIRLPDGKDSFFFVLDIKNAKIDTWGSKSQCRSTTNGLGCAGWIKRNGWKIPEDYPIKF